MAGRIRVVVTDSAESTFEFVDHGERRSRNHVKHHGQRSRDKACMRVLEGAPDLDFVQVTSLVILEGREGNPL